MRDQVFGKAVEAGGRLTVRSALNPILWLCGIVTIPTLLAGALRPELPLWVPIVGCAPVAAALFGFLFLLFFDRDKLQSEDYQIQKRTIELAQQKGESAPLLTDSMPAVLNPDFQELPDLVQESRK